MAIDGHDVTAAIRTPEVDKLASTVARLPQVREALVSCQRAIGEQCGVATEGATSAASCSRMLTSRLTSMSAEERAVAARTTRLTPEARQGRWRGDAIQARDLSEQTRVASPPRSLQALSASTPWYMPIESVVERVVALVRKQRPSHRACFPCIACCGARSSTLYWRQGR